jgi:hypothetical protein
VMASMEIAPGAIPHPGRVPEQRLLSPEIHRWRRWSCGTSSGKLPIDLGFRLQRELIGGREVSEVDQGLHTIGWHTQGSTRATPWCGGSLAPLRLSFGLCPTSEKNRRFGLRFVQFREYFLCSFSKTAKNRELALWHLVNRLVLENT